MIHGNRRLITGVLGAIVLLGTGCAVLNRQPAKDSLIIDSAQGADPSVTPFRLDVVAESNDGEMLMIKGHVVPKTAWPSRDVLVRLTALNDDGEQRVSFHRFSDISAVEKLKAREPSRFSLSLPSRGISNYQLEVLWGKDAAPYLSNPKASLKLPAASEEFLALRGLEVHRIPDDNCGSPEECLVKFSLKGEFFNSGRATIKNVVLVAGFTPSDKLDLQEQILENERRIEVRNMRLAGGSTKPFRLTLEKRIPATGEVAYQPVVRIVSFDSD